MNTPEINLENKFKAEILNELEELTKWYGKTPEHKQWVIIAGHLTLISVVKTLVKSVVSVEDLPMMMKVFITAGSGALYGWSKSKMEELMNSPNHLVVENANHYAQIVGTMRERRKEKRKLFRF